MKNSNDPRFPGEKEVNTKDIFVWLWIGFVIVSGLIAMYALIWAAWPVFRSAMTVLVTSGLFLGLTVAFFPDGE